MSRTNISSVGNAFCDILKGFVDEKGGALVVICDPYYLPHTLKGGVLEDIIPIGISETPPRSY